MTLNRKVALMLMGILALYDCSILIGAQNQPIGDIDVKIVAEKTGALMEGLESVKKSLKGLKLDCAIFTRLKEQVEDEVGTILEQNSRIADHYIKALQKEGLDAALVAQEFKLIFASAELEIKQFRAYVEFFEDIAGVEKRRFLTFPLISSPMEFLSNDTLKLRQQKKVIDTQLAEIRKKLKQDSIAPVTDSDSDSDED